MPKRVGDNMLKKVTLYVADPEQAAGESRCLGLLKNAEAELIATMKRKMTGRTFIMPIFEEETRSKNQSYCEDEIVQWEVRSAVFFDKHLLLADDRFGFYSGNQQK